MPTFSGKFSNCPAMERIIKASESGHPTIKSPEMKIGAESDVLEAELILPMPACKLAVFE